VEEGDIHTAYTIETSSLNRVSWLRSNVSSHLQSAGKGRRFKSGLRHRLS
jgi:hypothetical protein